MSQPEQSESMVAQVTSESLEELRMETEVLTKLMREDGKGGWQITACIDDVPEEPGHYALYDGLNSRGAGVTYNMRQSIKQCYWFHQLRRPIFQWLSDTDGSTALWLDRKFRCSLCPTETIVDFADEDTHYRDAHDIVPAFGA